MKTKTKKRTLLALAMLAVMVFAMSIVSGAAASKVAGLTQSDASTSSFKVTWTAQAGVYGYEVAISKDKKTWESQLDYTNFSTTSNSYIVYKRVAGEAYYVRVRGVDREWNKTTSSYDYTYGAWSDVIQAVVTPDEPATFKQTKATATKVTLKWSAVTGATKYQIYRNNTRVATVTKTTATIKQSAGTSQKYYIYPVQTSANGYSAKNNCYKYVYAKTAPAKAVNVADVDAGNLSWNPETNKVTLKLDINPNDEITPDGYQVQIKSVDGKKKIKTLTITNMYSRSCDFTYKAVKNKGFQVRVRGYVVVNDSKQYGSWTKAKVVIPQARVYLEQTSATKLKVTWDAVKGATKYTVYAAKNKSLSVSVSKLKYKKIKTLSSKKRSLTISNLKTGTYTYVYVLPTVKVGSKSYVGDGGYYNYKYMYSYY